MRVRVLSLIVVLLSTPVLKAQTPAPHHPAAPAAPAAPSLVGTWKAATERLPLTGEFNEKVWGKNATSVRDVSLVIKAGGNATLTVSRKVLDARGRVVPGSPSIEEAEIHHRRRHAGVCHPSRARRARRQGRTPLSGQRQRSLAARSTGGSHRHLQRRSQCRGGTVRACRRSGQLLGTVDTGCRADANLIQCTAGGDRHDVGLARDQPARSTRSERVAQSGRSSNGLSGSLLARVRDTAWSRSWQASTRARARSTWVFAAVIDVCNRSSRSDVCCSVTDTGGKIMPVTPAAPICLG